jgi:hypothetical protein
MSKAKYRCVADDIAALKKPNRNTIPPTTLNIPKSSTPSVFKTTLDV